MCLVAIAEGVDIGLYDAGEAEGVGPVRLGVASGRAGGGGGGAEAEVRRCVLLRVEML